MMLNIIVLLFEVLYYSIFINEARGDKKLIRYFIAFALVTIIGIFIKTNYFVSYLILIFMMLYAIKYIARVNTTLYDLLIIILMLILKTIIEMPIYYLLVGKINRYVLSILASLVKLLVLFLLNKRLNKFYNYLQIKWNNNNFYIRYLFSVMLYLYVIIVAILLIAK